MKFVDLNAQISAYKEEIRAEMDKVLRSASFINGPAVAELEAALAAFCGVKYAIACASGTDALLLGLMAQNVQPGDEIIVPDFTFIATASMVSFYKARPVFVDVDPLSFTIDPQRIKEAITPRSVGIIPVSLYGQCADMDAINAIAAENGLWVMEDGAQSFGASYKGRSSCTLSDLAVTSFFPAKPLGCFGDGGAVFTDDENLAEEIRILRNHGQQKRYYHQKIGINGRMDTLQAAVLKVKLSHFRDELRMRQAAAERYSRMLADCADIPALAAGNTSSWAQYTIRINNRDEVRRRLEEAGIPSAVHYPRPLHQQDAFRELSPRMPCPVSEELSECVLSLPMHAFISEEDQCEVVTQLKRMMDG